MENEIRSVLAKEDLSFAELRDLYNKYGKNAGVKRTAASMTENSAMRRRLIGELKLLEGRIAASGPEPQTQELAPGEVPPQDPVDPDSLEAEVTEETRPDSLEAEAIEETGPDETLGEIMSGLDPGDLPMEVQLMIQARSAAINRREQAGQILGDEAGNLSKEQRSELMITQKEAHEVVMRITSDLEKWRETGELPAPELSEEERERLEAEWKEQLRVRSRCKKAVKNWTERDDQVKVQYHDTNLKKAQDRLDELAKILNKKQRS